MRARAVAPWLQAALGASAVVALADAVIRLQRAMAIGTFLSDGTPSAGQAIALADRRVIAIGRADLAWLIVTGVLFMVWMGFAYSDLVRSGARHQMAPAVAVIGPFIPIASLLLMPRAMSDLERQSRFPRTWRVGWWFAAYLLANVGRFIGLSLVDTGGFEEYQRSDRVLAASDVVEVVAALLLIGLIAAIAGRAEDRRREAALVAAADEALDPDAMGRAMGWYRDPRRQAEVRWWDGTAWTTDVASTRQAPPPVVRVSPSSEGQPAFGAKDMPKTAMLCLPLGILAILFVFAPFSLGLGLWALRDLRARPGAPGKARAWFAVVMGALFTIFFVMALVAG